jgi:hypothetical protein
MIDYYLIKNASQLSSISKEPYPAFVPFDFDLGQYQRRALGGFRRLLN